ncbi:MAG: competence protein CoiA family protein [Treponematales bacterium]
MLKELLHPIAVDKNGNLIHIRNAEKGGDYYCPHCKSKFVFNRSIKTGKGSRRPHFSHDKLSPNCTPEGYLHSTFKIQLLEKLNQCISSHLPLEVKYKCDICQMEHTAANLLKVVSAVKAEHDMKVCRPDIALFDGNGRVITVIEIVVTHEPEEAAITYYKENGIVLIQINLDSEDDLERVDEKIKVPSKVITFHPLLCPVVYQQCQRQMLLQRQFSGIPGYGITRGGPKIEHIESAKMANERKRHFAIKNYYRNKRRGRR